MASPWISPPPPRRATSDRPWMGLALLLAVPFLSLILVRMMWSGSTLWYLIAAVLLLGGAAFAFLSRRASPSYGYPTLSPEPNRLPLALLGLGVLFLGLLVLPNMSSGDSSSGRLRTSNPGGQLASNPTVVQTPNAQPTAQPTQAPRQASSQSTPSSQSDTEAPDTSPPASGETYVVQDGDTLWDIASRYNTTVDDIIAANSLENAAPLTLGQELLIPAPSATADTAAPDTATEPEVTPAQ